MCDHTAEIAGSEESVQPKEHLEQCQGPHVISQTYVVR